MKTLDYHYNLNPDWQCKVNVSLVGKSNYKLAIENQNIELSKHTVLLRFNYRSTNKKRQGEIASFKNGKTPSIFDKQFFEPNQQGFRHLNLSEITSFDDLIFACKFCEIEENAELLGFKNPEFKNNPILILAPHADDAELAAYGFYQNHASQAWITTVFAGETLQKLDKQYIRNLDSDFETATERKAKIRAWNSMTTPLLAGISAEKLIYLGYSDLSLTSLYKSPKIKEKTTKNNKIEYAIETNSYRQWNKIKLKTDQNTKHNRSDALISDLVEVINQVQPSIILVTDPVIDPHSEHIITAHALSLALQQSTHQPDKILMYVNHLRNIKNFPYGPEFSKTALPPWHEKESIFPSLSVYSHYLDLSTQKDKVVALDSMHDLRSKDRLERTFKQWVSTTIKKDGYQYFGNHQYFQTHIKSNEVFSVVSIADFITCCQNLKL